MKINLEAALYLLLILFRKMISTSKSSMSPNVKRKEDLYKALRNFVLEVKIYKRDLTPV